MSASQSRSFITPKEPPLPEMASTADPAFVEAQWEAEVEAVIAGHASRLVAENRNEPGTTQSLPRVPRAVPPRPSRKSSRRKSERDDLVVKISMTGQVLARIADTFPFLAAYVDADERYVFVNRVYEDVRWFGRPRAFFSRKTIREAIGETEYARIQPYIVRVLQGETVTYEIAATESSVGAVRRATYIPDMDYQTGRVVGYISLINEVAARVSAEDAWRESQRFLSSLISNLPGVVYRFGYTEEALTALSVSALERLDLEVHPLPFQFVSDGVEAITGYRPTQFAPSGPMYWAHLIHPDDRVRVQNEFRNHIREQNPYQMTYRIVTAGGKVRWVAGYGRGIYEEGRIIGAEGFVTDVTERREAEARAQWHAHHDTLTELPNRVLFRDRVQRALASAARHGQELAVLFLDLDGFKFVNDTLGHDTGDALLQIVASRLAGALRGEDSVARMGGDEFTVLLPHLSQKDEPARVAENLLETFNTPFYLKGHELRLSASIGIAISPTDGTDDETLLRRADVAMYQAKEAGRNTYRQYTNEMSNAAFERLMLESDLRRAVERNELVLLYQPVIDAKNGAITGVEALLRWHHETLGPISAPRLIALAEETGLIRAVGDWAMSEACQQAARWLALGKPVPVSVNLSAWQLRRADFVQQVEASLAAARLPAHLLELEMTESAIQKSGEGVEETLRAICALGVRIAVDDFGTGYSSLSNLRRLPLSTVKVDGSFANEMLDEPQTQAIVRGVIDLSHALGLRVIAEGVETESLSTALSNLGCDALQGYWFMAPSEAARIAELL